MDFSLSWRFHDEIKLNFLSLILNSCLGGFLVNLIYVLSIQVQHHQWTHCVTNAQIHLQLLMHRLVCAETFSSEETKANITLLEIYHGICGLVVKMTWSRDISKPISYHSCVIWSSGSTKHARNVDQIQIMLRIKMFDVALMHFQANCPSVFICNGFRGG